MNQRRGLIGILLLSLLGLAASLYLTWLHQQILTDKLTGFGICDFSRNVSCEAVSASSWSEWFGIPIAWLGAMAYLLWLSLAGIGLKSKYTSSAVGLIFLIAVIAVGIDVYLCYVMAFSVRILCLFCLLTYLLNLCILYLAWRLGKRRTVSLFPGSDFAGDESKLSPFFREWMRQTVLNTLPFSGKTSYVFPLIFTLIAIVATMGAYQLNQAVARATPDFNETAFARFSATAHRITVDTSRDPYLGAPDAKLTIVEFSDFQCPYCRRVHIMLQTILPAYEDRVKFVFKNLPLGVDCNPILKARYGRDIHPSACGLARLGEAAVRQHQFWPLHDLIFKVQPDFEGKRLSRNELLELAKTAGLDMKRLKADLNDPETDQAMIADVHAAYRAGANATPTFLFNGLKVEGMPSITILQRIIEIELTRASHE